MKTGHIHIHIKKILKDKKKKTKTKQELELKTPCPEKIVFIVPIESFSKKKSYQKVKTNFFIKISLLNSNSQLEIVGTKSQEIHLSASAFRD